jgi:signal transduction histidine kinase
MHKILYRPIVVITLALGMLIIFQLLALGSITWRNLNRIDKIKQDIAQSHELEQITFNILNAAKNPEKNAHQAIKNKEEFHTKLIKLFASPHGEEKETEVLLEKIKSLFLNIEQGKQHEIGEVLAVVENILNLQRANEEKLLLAVYDDSRLELNFAVFLPVAILFPVLLFGVFYFRRQILFPLNSLEQLLTRLTKGEMQPFEENRKEPLLQPLFNSYNRLIKRLGELEEEHLTHTQTLEREVRNATHALLEQSHSLARSERLAAVGELAASAAHELRNPLAGIQAALENMTVECEDLEMGQRLKLVGEEIKRLTSRLNHLLAYSKHQPEPAQTVDISKLVHELLTLLKYQVNENIQFVYSIPTGIEFKLPETEFRQALLNLLLNSVHELGKKGGAINLDIHKQKDSLKIKITDNGKGFPKTILEQGIRPFTSYHESGTGLGLLMVLRFARSLGGQLDLSNDSEGHACVELNIPQGL